MANGCSFVFIINGVTAYHECVNHLRDATLMVSKQRRNSTKHASKQLGVGRVHDYPKGL